MQSEIAKTVELLRNLPEMESRELYQMLVETGVGQLLAARLSEFVPMAYCRVLFEPKGACFPNTFHRFQRDGNKSPAQPLSSEPVWNAGIDYAQREMESGVSLDKMVCVARRSAEYWIANDLLSDKNSKLKDIVFTPPVLMWPEEGPE
jgi:hypothetical protein